MPDYNIYIHSNETGGGISSQTKPWNIEEESIGSSATQPWATKATKAIGMATNPDGLVSLGISNAMRLVPAVAVAFLVTKTASAIYETNINIATIKSGDYSKVIRHNNFKQAINVLTHPFSSTLNAIRQNIEWEVENDRRELQRELLGDSVINSYSNRGI